MTDPFTSHGDDLSWEEEKNDSLNEWRRLFSDDSTTDYLIAVALTTSDPSAYVEAINILQLRGNQEVLEAARTLCGSILPEERKLGATILSRLGDAAPALRVARRLRMSGEEGMLPSAEKLEAPFGDEVKERRAYPKEALGILLPMLERENDSETLREILCAVAEYQDYHPSITERIAAFRTHPDPHVRFTVSTRLALNLDHPVALQALNEMAHDNDAEVRRAAENWLELANMRHAARRRKNRNAYPGSSTTGYPLTRTRDKGVNMHTDHTTSHIAAGVQPYVERHELAGAVALTANREAVLSLDTVGYADIAARQPMRPDSLFWIASMTKPITGAAFMMLVDEGKVCVDDPVEKYLPEFADSWLIVEQDAEHRCSHDRRTPSPCGISSPIPAACPLPRRWNAHARPAPAA